jgi:hypothetical protein
MASAKRSFQRWYKIETIAPNDSPDLMNHRAEKWRRYRQALRLVGCGSGTPLSLPLGGAERGALRQQSFRSSRAAGILVTTLLAACVAAKPDNPERPVLASRYYGTWTVDNSLYPFWWVMDSKEGAVGYVYKKDGTCGSGHAMVLGPDRIDVLSLDKAGNETRHIYSLHRAEGDLLLFWGEDQESGGIHRRVTPSDICKRADGTYAEWAPSAPRSR